MAQVARQVVPELEYSVEVCIGKIRTIVVDDTDVVLDVICALLESTGPVEIVGRATNGIEALEMVSALSPDLVVMDINMPKLDGIQAARLLAQHYPDLKVVLMSANDSPKVREQCRETGVHGFASKITFRQDFMLALNGLFSKSALPTA